MKYNPTAKTTHYFVQDQMMLQQNYAWNPNGSNGRGDSISRSRDAYYCYGDPQFVDGVKNCWVRINCDPYMEDCTKWDYYYKGYRYPSPDYEKRDFSRDHTSATIVLLKLADDPFLKELATHLRWTIRKNHITSKGKKRSHHFTPALWGFVKNFAGKWWGRPLFYGMTFLEIILYNIQNKFVFLMGGFGREMNQDEYNRLKPTIQKQSKWKQFWAKLVFPVYALTLLGWQLYVMDDSFMKRLLQYMSYPLIPRYNYFLKLLFNVGRVEKKDVLTYKSMKGGRWGTILNEINDRDVFIIKDEEWLKANVLDEDMLKAIWNIRHPEDQITE